MKAQVKFCWFAMLAIIALMTYIPVGCGKKPTSSKSELIIKNDSVNHSRTEKEVTDRSKAINDSLILLIANIRTAKKECDSVCQEAIDEALSRANTVKKSGDNSYGIYYDKYNKLLKLYVNLAETASYEKITTDTRYIRRYYKHQTTVTITKTVSHTPAYMKWSAWLGWISILYFIVKARSWVLNRKLLS